MRDLTNKWMEVVEYFESIAWEREPHVALDYCRISDPRQIEARKKNGSLVKGTSAWASLYRFEYEKDSEKTRWKHFATTIYTDPCDALDDLMRQIKDFLNERRHHR